MEALRGNQSSISQLQVLSEKKQDIKHWLVMPKANPDIICQYGVVVQQTSVAGLELIEIEFLLDAT